MNDLFPAELAAACAELAGQKYRPANATEGHLFQSRFCARCMQAKGDEGDDDCPIIFLSMMFDTDDDDYPPQLTYSADGQPTCTEYEPDPYYCREMEAA
jgi:hypothetical protein